MSVLDTICKGWLGILIFLIGFGLAAFLKKKKKFSGGSLWAGMFIILGVNARKHKCHAHLQKSYFMLTNLANKKRLMLELSANKIFHAHIICK